MYEGWGFPALSGEEGRTLDLLITNQPREQSEHTPEDLSAQETEDLD